MTTRLGVSAPVFSDARQAKAADARRVALLDLAVAINQSRGRISDKSLVAARAAGIVDAEIVEVVAHVALNVFALPEQRSGNDDRLFRRTLGGQGVR
jgi:hypothetical protein